MIASISAFVVGTVAALFTVFTLVSGTLGAPDANPADQPVISYGSNR